MWSDADKENMCEQMSTRICVKMGFHAGEKKRKRECENEWG